MNIALILSGGTGSRIGGDVPKQYLEWNGKPVIGYCLAVFGQHEEIDAVQIAAEEKWHDCILKWTDRKFRGFSAPGENRQLSIWNALNDMKKYADDKAVVIIHDAARPFVTARLISDCLYACQEHEGAIPVLPMKDTVYLGDGNQIKSLLERRNVYAGQAPEAFLFGRYFEANRRLLPDKIRDINGSTEPAVMAGMDVALVPGDENNFKITTKEDLERFWQIMKGKGVAEKTGDYGKAERLLV